MDDKSVWQSMCYPVIVDSNIKNHRSHPVCIEILLCFISDLMLENNDIHDSSIGYAGCSDATVILRTDLFIVNDDH